MPTLQYQRSPLADPNTQLKSLNEGSESLSQLPKFHSKLESSGLFPLKRVALEIFQVNVGKMCNQICRHCHVDAGPDRKEIMTRETMQDCLAALAKTEAKTVDLTGGAPEMNPDFRWFVEEIHRMGRTPLVRCNLTILLANKKYEDLPQFYKDNGVYVVSSLPFYDSKRTDRQRGDGVFGKSIEALIRLNKVGYGVEGSGLPLDLVYNPVGAFLPGDQVALEQEFKTRLFEDFGIRFNRLLTITNMPISRYLEYLLDSDNLSDYMTKLVEAYNPTAAAQVMCRNTLSVGWDGQCYDCDFNQMLEMPVRDASGKAVHVRDFDLDWLQKSAIQIDQHCYGCTAGAGSSCGGSLEPEDG